MELYKHQKQVLKDTENRNRVAYYLDMGLGKTFVGSEKLHSLGAKTNLLICQKSKIKDWSSHFTSHYDYHVYDLTKPKQLLAFAGDDSAKVGIVNYELAWRRAENFLSLKDYTLMLDESSLIQNEKAKQSKFILKLNPANVILLSGTPVGGKYENLWSQARLLGWNISKYAYDTTYVNFTTIYDHMRMPHRVVNKNNPYRNVERLKYNLITNGAVFMKSDSVLDLPEQVFTTIQCSNTAYYKRFLKDSYVILKDGTELMGTNPLTTRLYAKQLCSAFNDNKSVAFRDLISSTNNRVIVFYCFNSELAILKSICEELNRSVSVINGHTKDLTAYENDDDSITLVQYQAGAMGLNLQKSNTIVYFSLCDSSELFEQSKKRIHRIGQKSTCFYYILETENSVDGAIRDALNKKQDFTEELFKKCLFCN